MDRLSHFKLGMDVVIKADKDWRGVGRPQVAMHSHLPRFLVLTRFVHSAETAHHIYTVDPVVGYTRSSRSAFFLAPFLILQRPKSAKFGHDFRTRSTILEFEPL